jgi:predicted nucleic acid-binding protein
VSLVVLDASVAVKWFLPEQVETLTSEALALLNSCRKKEIHIIVPDLFWVEFASVLWKAIRRGNYSKASADAARGYLKDLDFPTIPSLELLDRAFEIATAFERSVYDSVYVALAVQTQSQLITADERLANSLAARFPVKWLGAM